MLQLLQEQRRASEMLPVHVMSSVVLGQQQINLSSSMHNTHDSAEPTQDAAWRKPAYGGSGCSQQRLRPRMRTASRS